MRVAITLLVPMLAAGCEAPSSLPQVSSVSSVSSAASSAKIVTTVIVRGDGHERGVALTADTRIPLRNVLPDGLKDRNRWKLLVARAHDGRTFVLEDWAKNYDGFKIVLHVDDQQRAALSIFKLFSNDSATKIPAEKPRGYFGGVREIEVMSTLPAVEPPPGLVVYVDGKRQEIARAQLEILALADRKRGSWHLRDVISLIKPLDQIASVEVIAKKKRVMLTRAQLSTERVTLRYNRKGELRIDLSLDGRSKERLRDLIELNVTLATDR